MSSPAAELEAKIRSLDFHDKTGLIRALFADLTALSKPTSRRRGSKRSNGGHRMIMDGTVQPVRLFENLRAP
jgi:hypothetical protein